MKIILWKNVYVFYIMIEWSVDMPKGEHVCRRNFFEIHTIALKSPSRGPLTIKYKIFAEN